jgi:DNA-binding response OmpR family regulator
MNVKKALIVDPRGTVEDFARSALGMYEQTTVGSWQEGLALVSGVDYDLVLLAEPEHQCDDSTWALVGQIAQAASGGQALIMILTERPNVEFQARAAELGITVVGAPLGVGALSLIDEAPAR